MFQDKTSIIRKTIISELHELNGLKFSFGLIVDFSKNKKSIQGTFYSNQYAITTEDKIDEIYGEAVSTIDNKIIKNTKEGSGWTIDRCKCLYCSED